MVSWGFLTTSPGLCLRCIGGMLSTVMFLSLVPLIGLFAKQISLQSRTCLAELTASYMVECSSFSYFFFWEGSSSVTTKKAPYPGCATDNKAWRTRTSCSVRAGSTRSQQSISIGHIYRDVPQSWKNAKDIIDVDR
eukprot:gnl/MRDRNA2_/MRDRNA2_72178_c0_seq4.p1 gnl/MRDRNA2_/MRDRNA2_72178_c0~~gnl/MRDRNA2_/MRDRNA2_72178_c0_seq4.p1  ORF type:complete len:136 (-),score=7.93 gnl/MRDRNA2_/MRDRNA2_72178_c0_seq4:27-434(-)